ncbi:hypothetical protein N866_18210 [Actinotalea ferrariae CF5-4]|uniref:DUF3093 domain-containing protein n=1 Tax=Actinotalea ferrariae CF5-4 TaxID=948458 RepID=A0A021VRN4_9CELL|nr:DUF3093 domain-containing protein [Actinotalea ferrariae]EYR63783.1 hypothetical protein N866_18210 [Actinotalea ferrariae CF5-4]
MPTEPRRADVDPGPPPFAERLLPGPLGWSFVLGFAVFVLIALVPVDVVVAALVAAVTFVVGVAAVAATSAVVVVRDGSLRAGRARIPVDLLGPGRVLERDEARAALGPGSDARLFACYRSWLPGAVLVPVVDPLDPTPAWLVSSRSPRRLLAAIEAARGSTQAAHSEQIG